MRFKSSPEKYIAVFILYVYGSPLDGELKIGRLPATILKVVADKYQVADGALIETIPGYQYLRESQAIELKLQ